jgi:hypothetical protein
LENNLGRDKGNVVQKEGLDRSLEAFRNSSIDFDRVEKGYPHSVEELDTKNLNRNEENKPSNSKIRRIPIDQEMRLC